MHCWVGQIEPIVIFQVVELTGEDMSREMKYRGHSMHQFQQNPSDFSDCTSEPLHPGSESSSTLFS